MKTYIEFTKNEKSLISRAIMWFSRDKKHPERNCSHVYFKYQPGGIHGDEWFIFEAMERGCWLSPYKQAFGKQTIVGAFEVQASDQIHAEVMNELINEFCGDWYDYEGIIKWAWWVIRVKLFGTLVRLLKITFRPGRAHDGAFCSGLVLSGIQKYQKKIPDADFGMKKLTLRTSSPISEINICFENPTVYRNSLPISK